MTIMYRSTVLLAAAAAILLLGAGCRKEQPVTSPSTAVPTPAPAAPTAAPLSASLVAPAPTSPPPPDIPSVPSAPPNAADAVAPAPLPTKESPLLETVTPPAPEPPAAGPRVIRVVAKQWEWQPNEIRVKKDDRVVLEISNLDVPHGFALPDFNINRMLAPGATERIEFTADKVGRFDFVCSVFCGQGHRGMRGVLIVEE